MPETLISTTEQPPKKQTKVVKAGRTAGPWVTARKLAQYLALVIFIGLFVISRQGGWIRCGICEYKCPFSGDAAIRVYVPQKGVPF